jgi:hypothetical protein
MNPVTSDATTAPADANATTRLRNSMRPSLSRMLDAATHAPAQMKRGDITHYQTLSQAQNCVALAP